MSNQRKRSKVTEKPLIFPVSKDEVKAQIGLNDSYQDSFIETLIAAATDFCENYLGRKFIDQELTLYLDKWIYETNDLFWNGTIQAPESILTGRGWVELDWRPCQSITEITTFDRTNNETIYDSSNYMLDNNDDDMLSRIWLNEGSVLPSNIRVVNGYKVRYRAGYGTAASDVPAMIRQSIIMMVAFMFENRGDCSDMGQSFIGSGVADLLNTYKTLKI